MKLLHYIQVRKTRHEKQDNQSASKALVDDLAANMKTLETCGDGQDIYDYVTAQASPSYVKTMNKLIVSYMNYCRLNGFQYELIKRRKVWAR